MAFLWGANAATAQFDQLVAETTSDLLPAKSPLDLASALSLADSVRSAHVSPIHAATQLVNRLKHDNPNVQLLALDLADVLVKNAGNPFLAAFTSTSAPAAVSQLETLCTAPTVNRDVQHRARERLQHWAAAFEATRRPALAESDLVRAYRRLANSPGIEFPPTGGPDSSAATAAMVDSLSAPDWSDAPYCTRCRTEFSTFNRKHHCRNCGQVFDQQCSSQSMPLPHYGITTESVRVCDPCAKKIKQGQGAVVARTILQQRQHEHESTATTNAAVNASREEDADLQRAIQASLADVAATSSSAAAAHGPLRTDPAAGGGPPPRSSSTTSGYTPSYASQVQASSSDVKKSNSGAAKEDEDRNDPDLAAAIAASLRDLDKSQQRVPPPPAASAPPSAQTYTDLFPRTAAAAAAVAVAPPSSFHLPSYDLTPTDQSHLTSFLRSASSPHSSLHPQRDVAEAEYRLVVEEVQPRLERSFRDAKTRAEILREMESKLNEAARLYGAGLTERAQYRHQHHQRQHHAYGAASATSNLPSYAVPYPSASPYQQQPQPLGVATAADEAKYQYAPPPGPAGVGQPLPAYAVPAPVVPIGSPPSAAAGYVLQQPQEQYAPPTAAAAAPPPPQQQQQHYSQPQEQQQQPPPQQQHQRQQQQQQQGGVPVPAGYYKPSQFPTVPHTDPTMSLSSAAGAAAVLGTLPNVPGDGSNPWNRGQKEEQEQEEEEQEEAERAQVGELIEL